MYVPSWVYSLVTGLKKKKKKSEAKEKKEKKKKKKKRRKKRVATFRPASTFGAISFDVQNCSSAIHVILVGHFLLSLLVAIRYVYTSLISSYLELLYFIGFHSLDSVSRLRLFYLLLVDCRH